MPALSFVKYKCSDLGFEAEVGGPTGVHVVISHFEELQEMEVIKITCSCEKAYC